MKIKNKKVEHIVWNEKGKNIHAVGFIIKDTKSNFTIALTKSYGNYIDTKIIEKKRLILRELI